MEYPIIIYNSLAHERIFMLPEKGDIVWEKIVLGKKEIKFNTLGAKLFMNRILLSTKKDSTSKNVNKCIDELLEYLSKNETSMISELNEIRGSK